MYLPPDANSLRSVADHCLRSRNYVNVIVAGKQPEWQWMDIEQAMKQCTAGLGIWKWASNDQGCAPDVVMACAGDVPTLETLAAVDLLREQLPDLKVRVVNIVDLMTLQPQSEHPHGLGDREFNSIFTTDKPIVFTFHGCRTARRTLNSWSAINSSNTRCTLTSTVRTYQRCGIGAGTRPAKTVRKRQNVLALLPH